jgi:hypothetical protein
LGIWKLLLLHDIASVIGLFYEYLTKKSITVLPQLPFLLDLVPADILPKKESPLCKGLQWQHFSRTQKKACRSASSIDKAAGRNVL